MDKGDTLGAQGWKNRCQQRVLGVLAHLPLRPGGDTPTSARPLLPNAGPPSLGNFHTEAARSQINTLLRLRNRSIYFPPNSGT